MAVKELVIVRHGQSLANGAGVLSGRGDVGLDAVGRAQAAAVAGALGEVDRVVSSPLVRTLDTAAPLAQACGLDVETDERWLELDYGRWEGRALSEVSEREWAEFAADDEFAPPDGESLAGLYARVSEGLDELIDDAGRVAVFTHVSPVKAAVAATLGVGPSVSWRMWVANASITRIFLGPFGRSLRSFNETAHLR